MVTVKREFYDVDSWLELQSASFSNDEIKQFKCAIDFATACYQNKDFYPTKVSLMSYVLTCASKVAKLNLYADAVIATILYAIPKFVPNWKHELKEFDAKVLELIEGINRVTQIRHLSSWDKLENTQDRKQQVEVMRKMLLAMADDIRVVLIVLVGRGEMMLNLKSCEDFGLQQKIATETVEIFAPLANRLGMWQVKWELEDLSFKFLYPEQYSRIVSLLEETRQERLEYIEEIKSFLVDQMHQSGINEYQVSGRAKHIYSIWKKMKQKHYDFDDLYDIRAVRILVPETRDCYTVLGIVHTKYSPIPGLFDDYISNPKPNNYQSLHTCVLGPGNKVIEVQIRTFAMHHYAEYGVAAHWRYKEMATTGVKHNEEFVEKLAWIRQILDWRGAINNPEDIDSAFKTAVFNDHIYVITPQGRVIDMPRGATPIDFAYHIHTQLGHRCRGAKINGQMVPLATPLENGQQVEIITVKEGGPSVRWIHDGLAVTNKAIGAIKRYLKDQNIEEFVTIGTELLERELSKFITSTRPTVQKIVAKLGFANEKDMCIALGRGELNTNVLKSTVEKMIAQNEGPILKHEFAIPVAPNKTQNSKKSSPIYVNGVSGIASYLSKCCKPIPSDAIIGFITLGRGVAIHRSNCKEIVKKANSDQIINVSWGDGLASDVFCADVTINANDRPGLLRDVTEVLAMEKVSIVALKTVTKNNKLKLVFTLQIQGNNFDFVWLINKLFNISGVVDVARK